MAHQPEKVQQYVCENCQLTHAGTPIHLSGGDHRFESPDQCGGCGESTFIEIEDWARHHE